MDVRFLPLNSAASMTRVTRQGLGALQRLRAVAAGLKASNALPLRGSGEGRELLGAGRFWKDFLTWEEVVWRILEPIFSIILGRMISSDRCASFVPLGRMMYK